MQWIGAGAYLLPSRMSPRSDYKMVAEQKALSDGLSLMLQN